jgi:hypothetical protein
MIPLPLPLRRDGDRVHRSRRVRHALRAPRARRDRERQDDPAMADQFGVLQAAEKSSRED